MRVVLEDNKKIIFLNKEYLIKINFDDKKTTEVFLKDLFHKLELNYNLFFEGFYNVNIYIDQIYGAIIEVLKEDLEYFDYFDGQIEVSFKIIKKEFLYKLEELPQKNILSKFIIYKYKDNLYLKPQKALDNIEMGMLLEQSEIIFNQKAEDILKYSKIVKGWRLCEDQWWL